MIKVISCPDFDKDVKHLAKKYPSIKDDIEVVSSALQVDWVSLPHIERINNLWDDIVIPVFKLRRVWCKSLKNPTKLRLIFAYDANSNEIQLIQFLEIYAKWEKVMEDRNRIKKYLKRRNVLLN